MTGIRTRVGNVTPTKGLFLNALTQEPTQGPINLKSTVFFKFATALVDLLLIVFPGNHLSHEMCVH